MNRVTVPKRSNPSTLRSAPESRSEFNARLKTMQVRVPALASSLKADDFESWEDAAALFKHYPSADVESLRPADLPKRRRQIRGANRRNPGSRTSAPTRTNAGRTQAFSDMIAPGVSYGPPKRFIDTTAISPEIDYTKARFRRQRKGVGKCTGNNLKAVKRAYAFAYVMCEAAKREVRAILANPGDARILWHGSNQFAQASLAYWFGSDYSGPQQGRMLHKIDDMLSEWSTAFCGGFRNILPVFIRCKSLPPTAGNPPARHLVKNTIELMPRYFDMPPAQRAITLMHEMGHRCKSLLKPRDERHDLCTGGWNKKKNMCYRNSDDVTDFDDLFRAGNPFILADAAKRGNAGARKKALNNIDNYICYMWNRYVDHAEDLLDVLPPEVKKPKHKPSGRTSKPPSS